MRRACLAVALAAALGCSASAIRPSPAPVRPITSGADVLTPAAQAKADSGRPPYTRADVRFMQGMIGHHAQALTMTALVPTRTSRPNFRLLSERITVSQRDEIEPIPAAQLEQPAALHRRGLHAR